MNEVRKGRLEKQILRLMAELYFKELKNPDLGYATFTHCRLSNDYSHAKVYVAVLEGELAGAIVGDGGKDSVNKTMTALNKAKGFLKGKIGRALGTRATPEIEFILDTSFSDSERINALLYNNESK